jgi:hypothetical protein
MRLTYNEHADPDHDRLFWLAWLIHCIAHSAYGSPTGTAAHWACSCNCMCRTHHTWDCCFQQTQRLVHTGGYAGPAQSVGAWHSPAGVAASCSRPSWHTFSTRCTSAECCCWLPVQAHVTSACLQV